MEWNVFLKKKSFLQHLLFWGCFENLEKLLILYKFSRFCNFWPQRFQKQQILKIHKKFFELQICLNTAQNIFVDPSWIKIPSKSPPKIFNVPKTKMIQKHTGKGLQHPQITEKILRHHQKNTTCLQKRISATHVHKWTQF